jgi:hypothetical protein
VFTTVRLIGAAAALITAVVVGWQSIPPAPAGGGIVELRSTAAPMETTMKSPIVATTNPRPFDPCEDIPFDVVQRLGLAFTPPEHEDGPVRPPTCSGPTTSCLTTSSRVCCAPDG